MHCRRVSVNQACRRCLPRSATRSTRRRANACASSRCRNRSWCNHFNSHVQRPTPKNVSYWGLDLGSWELTPGTTGHRRHARRVAMKRAFIVVAFLFAVICVRAAAPPAALDSKGNGAISTFVKEAIARGDVPGAVILVTGADRVLYHEAFGKMN